ncbi:MAG TPA: nuclear transport factor 2 family protein [Candidatus Limnocylindria bacterium]|nr:nuclear transport factor 2 family protein [Candidatus Limnocylindria bacterium]HVS28125.1 nuclear transport factor 2 family protein [Solirubrobacteraceae bacterium]
MSHENVNVVRRFFEHFAAGEFEEALALFDDDLVTRRHAPLPDPGTWHGREGLRAAATSWMGVFGEYSMKAEEFIDAGERVVVRVLEEGRGTGSGVFVGGTFWHVYGLRDRKVVTMDWYTTDRQALESVGLRE